MDRVLDCETLETIGEALRDAYQLEMNEETPQELRDLCAELEQVSGAPSAERRH